MEFFHAVKIHKGKNLYPLKEYIHNGEKNLQPTLEKILGYAPAKSLSFNFIPGSGHFSNLFIPLKNNKKFYSTLYFPPCHSSHISLDSVTYTKLIQSSTKNGSTIHGKLSHAHMIKTKFKPCLFLLNNLLNMYCKHGEMHHASHLFNKMNKQNVVSYNLLISGYTQTGVYDKSLNLFYEAVAEGIKLDKFTYAGVIRVCSESRDLELGKLIHGLVIVGGFGAQVFVINTLIDMYCKCSKVDKARVLFEKSNKVDDVSWSSLISGYVRVGANEEMLKLLVKMHENGLNLNSYTIGCVLKACASDFNVNSVTYGRMLHGFTVKFGLDSDVVVGTALLNMYAKSRWLDEAVKVFKFTHEKNVVTYNAMINGFLEVDIVSDDCAKRAFEIFIEMQRNRMKPSKFTFSSILKASNAVEDFEYGKQIHGQIIKGNLQSDEFIGSSLIDLYSSLGSTEDGLKCYKTTPKLDIVLCTSMIAGYVQTKQFESAFSLFKELLALGMKADKFIISTVMAACGDIATAKSGEQIHGYGIKCGVSNSTVVQNSQICMYAKCGDLNSVYIIFEGMENRTDVSWSVMIHSQAQHGRAQETLKLFNLMMGVGIVPNEITFLGVLTACSHGGLVEEGLQYFTSMKKEHGLTPNVKHYACVVDLLARAGRLAEAEDLILKSGFENIPEIWRALLSACRVYMDWVTGKRIAEKVIDLEPKAASSYVLLYNIYLDARMEKSALEVRELMKDRGIKKEPGLSWIEVENKVHSFVVGDTSHPMSQIIYAKLERMLEKLRETGYVNERVANHHSEKLAVTFGIISLPKLAPIRVMKNLRVCQDCHTTMKLLSKVENREIILRDPIRFHHFREGSCSCSDYW